MDNQEHPYHNILDYGEQPSLLLFLSFYLIILTFFIFLHSMSTINEKKSQYIIRNIQEVFSDKVEGLSYVGVAPQAHEDVRYTNIWVEDFVKLLQRKKYNLQLAHDPIRNILKYTTQTTSIWNYGTDSQDMPVIPLIKNLFEEAYGFQKQRDITDFKVIISMAPLTLNNETINKLAKALEVIGFKETQLIIETQSQLNPQDIEISFAKM